MYFSQPTFLPFLALGLMAFQVTPPSRRWATLLGLSLVYYATFQAPALLLVLGAEAVTAWAIARAVDHEDDEGRRWRWFLIGAGGLVATLVLVRLAGTSALTPTWWPGSARLGSTLGVSYYTLQALAYVADVYLGKSRAEPSLGRVATYLALFPKLVQGPIERAGALLPQLDTPQVPGYQGLRAAALLFGWGLFKKVVLGDRLAQVVDPVFAAPDGYGGLVTALAVYAYAFQLYFDFSGYTDMARGVARAFGLELGENFRAPYLAPSISEFWRRWHITFSRWLLDYVFTPLQAAWRRSPVAGTALALFLTFGLSGLWHGLSVPFLVWGLLHGTYLAVESVWRRRRGATPLGQFRRALGVLITFHLVVLAWVFFRAPSLAGAWRVLSSAAGPTRGLGELVAAAGGRLAVASTLAACGAYSLVVSLQGRQVVLGPWRRAPFRWACYYALIAAIIHLRQESAGFLYALF